MMMIVTTMTMIMMIAAVSQKNRGTEVHEIMRGKTNLFTKLM
jgi:hypothetical protein